MLKRVKRRRAKSSSRKINGRRTIQALHQDLLT